MKWPESVTLIRHDVSAFNVLKKWTKTDQKYQQFKEAYEKNPNSPRTRELAEQVWEKMRLNHGDHNTPLAPNEGHQAVKTGEVLSKVHELPDVIFVSPYQRTLQTFQKLKEGWAALEGVKVYEEERIREQEHGLALIYNDRRIFYVMHPEQKMLQDIEQPYWYRYPQGENVPDVRLRVRSWMQTLLRDFVGKRVLAITHHLTILAIRANFERLNAKEFIRLDKEDAPINCGVTCYVGNPRIGGDGRMELRYYNSKLY